MPRYVIRSTEDLGRAIAELRHARGLSQQELADQLGIERSYVSKLEGGRFSRVLDLLIEAASRLGGEIAVEASAPPASTEPGRGG